MPQVTAYDDIAPERVIHNRGNDENHPSADVYPFIGSPLDKQGANAFLVRYIPGTTSSAHFHAADQMQIIVEGRGRLAHHEMRPYQVHFSRAYTPYGPLLPDPQEGWAFINLRTRRDPEGAQRLPGARDKLLQVAGRRPFQTHSDVAFPAAGIVEIDGMKDDEGLEGFAVTLAPHARMTAPSPAHGDGQYVLVVKGSLVHEGRARKALVIVHVKPDEEPFELLAGPEGLEAMILNFPRLDAAAVPDQEAPMARPVPEAPDAEGRPADKSWACLMCNFVYIESEGLPEEGIAPGTRWEDVPETWTCPDCNVTKADFVMVEF